MRFADDLIDGRGSDRGGHELRRPDNGAGEAGREKRGAFLDEQPGQGFVVFCRGERAKCILGPAVRREPHGRRAMERPRLRFLERPRVTGVLPHEAVQHVPPVRDLGRETSANECRQRSVRVVNAERGAEVDRDPVERRQPPEQLEDLRRVARKRFSREIGIELATGAEQACERRLAARSIRLALERIEREPYRGRPAAGRLDECLCEGLVLVPRRDEDQLGELVDVEGEHRPRQLEHGTLAAETVDPERRFRARRENQMEVRRRLPAETLDEPCRTGSLPRSRAHRRGRA